jgi:hypothetical protein
MEIITHSNETTNFHIPEAALLNDNRRRPLSMGRSVFPDDAVARICKPSRAVTTSGKARTKGWSLIFERRSAPFIEPLMGYTGGDDTLTQVELGFPTLDSAIRYAERQGLTYVVQTPTERDGNANRQRTNGTPNSNGGSRRAFSDSTLDRLGLSIVRESYGRALGGAAERMDPSGLDRWTTPMDVVHDSALTLEAKRSILMDWAWTEHLIDQATNEGMPEYNRPSLLDEVEQALVALERKAAGEAYSGTQKAA